MSEDNDIENKIDGTKYIIYFIAMLAFICAFIASMLSVFIYGGSIVDALLYFILFCVTLYLTNKEGKV